MLARYDLFPEASDFNFIRRTVIVQYYIFLSIPELLLYKYTNTDSPVSLPFHCIQLLQ